MILSDFDPRPKNWHVSHTQQVDSFWIRRSYSFAVGTAAGTGMGPHPWLNQRSLCTSQASSLEYAMIHHDPWNLCLYTFPLHPFAIFGHIQVAMCHRISSAPQTRTDSANLQVTPDRRSPEPPTERPTSTPLSDGRDWSISFGQWLLWKLRWGE